MRSFSTVEEFEKKKVETMEDFEKSKAIDQTVLLSDLSHQLEEARTEIDSLKTKNRELRTSLLRTEGARDMLKEMFYELNAKSYSAQLAHKAEEV
jgi:hypothetical protein